MKKYIFLSLAFSFFFIVPVKAQDALSIFQYNFDPYANAVGLSGVANINSGPAGYFYNPALLGFLSRKVNFAFETLTHHSPSSTNNLISDNFELGYKIPNTIPKLDMSIGFGYQRDRENFRNDSFTKDIYSFGFSLDYYVTLAFGMNFKNYFSHFERYHDEDINVHDWGLLLNVPVLKLLDDNIVYKAGKFELVPFFNFSLGYSRSNLGDEYISSLGTKEIPDLTARLGYNISLGSDLVIPGGTLQLADITLMIDASQVLTEYDRYLNKHYKSGLGDIDFGENLLKWKGTEKVELHKGFSISLLETVSVLRGSYQIRVLPGNPTEGYSVTSNGIFKLLSSYSVTDNTYFKYALDHLEFKYTMGSITYWLGMNNSLFRLNYSSLSVSIKNLTI